jgi:hypothetical protein
VISVSRARLAKSVMALLRHVLIVLAGDTKIKRGKQRAMALIAGSTAKRTPPQ